MLLWRGDGETDRHHVEERRIGELGAGNAKIGADVEQEFEHADARVVRRDQRLIGAALPPLVPLESSTLEVPGVPVNEPLLLES